MDHWCWKRMLYQLSLYHCPFQTQLYSTSVCQVSQIHVDSCLMAVFFVRQLSVDGVKRSSASADSSFFRQFTLSRSRRNSAVSSIGSIDRVGISEYESVVSFIEVLTNATIKVITRKVITIKGSHTVITENAVHRI